MVGLAGEVRSCSCLIVCSHRDHRQILGNAAPRALHNPITGSHTEACNCRLMHYSADRLHCANARRHVKAGPFDRGFC
jgi:hypothetical protein